MALGKVTGGTRGFEKLTGWICRLCNVGFIAVSMKINVLILKNTLQESNGPVLGCGKLAIMYLHVWCLELGQLDVWCLIEWWSTMDQ